MKYLIHLLALISLVTNFELFSQPRWVTLPAIPQNNARFDDIFFINLNTGWTVTSQGKVFKTSNGGFNWLQQSTPAGGSWLSSSGKFLFHHLYTAQHL